MNPLVRNEEDPRTVQSPTSPMADDLVEAAVSQARADTGRKLSEISSSDITQVTPRGEIIAFNYRPFTALF